MVMEMDLLIILVSVILTILGITAYYRYVYLAIAKKQENESKGLHLFLGLLFLGLGTWRLFTLTELFSFGTLIGCVWLLLSLLNFKDVINFRKPKGS
jgi:hypothetical protein